jgi:hypothetical protein
LSKIWAVVTKQRVLSVSSQQPRLLYCTAVH